MVAPVTSMRVVCTAATRSTGRPPMAAEAHVIPRGDLIDHQPAEACCCGPTCEPVERDDGSIGWLYVHHSLDAREATE